MRRPPAGSKPPDSNLSAKPQVSLADEMARLIAEHKGTAFVDRSDDNPFGWVDILTFCEDTFYLGEKLFPWQKLILKIFYMGTPGNDRLSLMDNPDPRCAHCVWSGNDLNRIGRSPCVTCSHYDDTLRQRDVEHIRMNPVLRRERKQMLLSPVEYTSHFANEVMLINNNLPADSDARSGGSVAKQVLRKVGKAFSELFLVLGRRSGKSQMAVWIALYEIYKLIEMGNPQRLLGLTDGSLVTVLNVAVAEEQATNAIFSKVRSAIERSPYFKTKMVPKSLRVASVKFLTPYDEERNIELEQEGFPPREGSIQFVSGNSSSSSQVGLNIPVIIIDEMASMGKDSGSSQSDAELYTALKNSVWNFPDYKIICISNPLSRDGKFYELYEDSFTDDRFLMFQLPSYIVNPAIPDEVLEEERRAAMSKGNLIGYQMHIEARFVGGTADPLVPAFLIDEAFQRGYRLVRSEYGDPRQSYYLHIDPALSDDNYALAIVHVETDPLRRSDSGDVERIVFVDHVQMWSPDRVTGTPVDIATVEQYVADLCTRFHIVSITSDQWGSWSTMQNFQRRGYPARVTPYNPDYVNRIFTNMVELFVQGRIVFYQYGPFASDAMEQWKYLQQKFTRRNTRVEAAEGHKDDIPACIAGASYVAISGEMSFAGLPDSVLVRANWDRSGNLSGGMFGGQQNNAWRGR